ncbi:adhesion G protein-coupled receptor B1-like [Ruditapes philippinarum]|uniref:adhesion G protein-coupled receptor B1-like n=1 Tax=Ruditapes philippinarum TaxID=129788 RepID=UPI00295BBDC8|nr:adhesion G protein-coupled receptor B1-like [Ruditapes philippinarum]
MSKPHSPVIYIRENDVARFECSVSGFPSSEIRWFKDNVTPLDYTDDIRITEDISTWFTADYETAYDFSYLNYTAKRTDNGMSIYCTGNNSANRSPVLSSLKPILFVQATHCLKEVDLRMMQWEKTDLGKNASVSCSSYLPELSGLISRQCLENGTWMQPIYDCISTDVADIQDIVFRINSGNFSKEIGKVLQKASEVTANQDPDKAFLCKDLDVITQTLEKIVSLEDWAVTLNQSKNFMMTVSNILETMNTIVLQSNSTNLKDTKCYQGVWKLLNIASAFSTILGGTLDETTSNKERTIHTENVLLQVNQVNSSSSVGLTFPDADKYPELSQIATLKLSVDSLKGSTLFYGILYKNVSALLAAETTYDSFKNGFLNSAVMGAKLDNWKNNSDFKVTIKFQHLKESNWRKTCTFMSENSTTWMKEGCYVKTSGSTTTTCDCNHLTNFAILMSPWTENSAETETLRIITIVGCSFSTLGLVITVMIHLYMWRYLKSDRATILMHLCVAMATSYVIFLGGVDRTNNIVYSLTICAGSLSKTQYVVKLYALIKY